MKSDDPAFPSSMRFRATCRVQPGTMANPAGDHDPAEGNLPAF